MADSGGNWFLGMSITNNKQRIKFMTKNLCKKVYNSASYTKAILQACVNVLLRTEPLKIAFT